MSTTTELLAAKAELQRVTAELAALRGGVEALVSDLRRYADPHDLLDEANPRHVSVGLVGIRLRSLLGGDS